MNDRGSGQIQPILKANREAAKIFRTFHSDRLKSPRGFFTQRLSAAAWTVGDAFTSCEFIEIVFFDGNIRPDRGSGPTGRKIEPGKYPCFEFFPGIFGDK